MIFVKAVIPKGAVFRASGILPNNNFASNKHSIGTVFVIAFKDLLSGADALTWDDIIFL